VGGCTNCHGKTGCDSRKGSMMASVDETLAHLYPARAWGPPAGRLDHAASDEGAALADELADVLDAATILVVNDAEAYCDYLYVLCVGRPPCAIAVRDAGVPVPAEWRGGEVHEGYLRLALSRLCPMAAVQEVAVDAFDDHGGVIVRETARPGVYSAPLLRRMQKLVATLPAYGIVHVDTGEIAGPPPGFAAGGWGELYAGVPAIANYLFQPQPLTMTSTTWVPREPPA
jgi:hypothetical protein